ncbi:endonuclease domain-containing protein [Methylobacterium aquaticum]|uniref:DUF559 domain-containing protein n=1 Tax=Methylobacterium aquaticum TaxID=270351 RepID=UPI0009E2BAED
MRGPDDPGTARARTLRRTQTDAERVKGSRLRDRRLAEAKFVRQPPIGRDFADLACREAKLIVALDGSQHVESGDDRDRDAFLTSQGWRVPRFWNGEIAHTMAGVLDTIVVCIMERRLSSSSRGRGEDVVDLVVDDVSAGESRSEGEGAAPKKAHPETPPHPRPAGLLRTRQGVRSPLPARGERRETARFPGPESPAASGEGHPAPSRTDP